MWCCHLPYFWKVWYVTTMISFSKVPGFHRRQEQKKANSCLGCSGRMCQEVEGGDSSLCSALVKPHPDYCVNSGLPGWRCRHTAVSPAEAHEDGWGHGESDIRRGWDSLEKTRCPRVVLSVRMGVNKVGCSNSPNKPKLLSTLAFGI